MYLYVLSCFFCRHEFVTRHKNMKEKMTFSFTACHVPKRIQVILLILSEFRLSHIQINMRVSAKLCY